jgi:hypothetical protein
VAKGVNLRTCSVAASSGMVVTRSVVWACACVMQEKAMTPKDTKDKNKVFEWRKLDMD